MRNITTANLNSIDTGFGFARNAEAGMGDVRSSVKNAALHLRLYTKRSHGSSPVASTGQRVAVIGERRSVLGCGMRPTGSCFGQIIARTRPSLRPSWRLQRVALVGPSVSPASCGIS